ncbi:MAG: 50S ribosomal protein L11 methyltransferase [Clostridia bacterium]|nr:50S ribosomal protein L11 methyltransferase [Clostridia bacterium]
MKYSEITVRTTSEMAEVVAYFLQEVCMDGVCIYDKKDLENASWDYKDENADKLYDTEVLVKGYCNKEDTPSVLNFLQQSFVGLQGAGSLQTEVNEVEGDSWVQTWKETFRPIETNKLVICPEWLSVETDKTVFLLDTGIAFGTGQHETTSMCLQFAENLDLTGKTVLDVGCGSGILGLCSLLLGAQSAELVDIDSQATEIACHNAQINGLQHKCVVKTGDLTEKTNGTFDVVFANLTADILALLFNGIAQVVHSGTLVVLSGILDTRLEQVVDLYSQKFNVLQTKQMGEWRALLLQTK